MKIFLTLLLFSHILLGLPKHYVSTSNITVGETFTYTIAIPSESSVTINPTLDNFNLINSSIEEDENERRYNYELQAFTIEELIIPTVSITEINDIPPVVLDPIFLMLETTLTSTANQLNDIAPLFSIFHINLLYLWIFLLILGIIVIAVISVVRKKKQQLYEQSLVKDPPIKIALKEISELKKSLTNDPQTIKQGYFKLTEIVCKFITAQTELNVLDATTIEMKRMLKTSQINTANTSTIINLSEKMDHFKFSESPVFQRNEIDQTILQAVDLLKGLSK